STSPPSSRSAPSVRTSRTRNGMNCGPRRRGQARDQPAPRRRPRLVESSRTEERLILREAVGARGEVAAPRAADGPAPPGRCRVLSYGGAAEGQAEEERTIRRGSTTTR